MSTPLRSIFTTLTSVQLLALESLNDTWLQRHRPVDLTTYAPAQRRAHAPIRRAAAWARTSDPLARALQHGLHEPVCLLMGEELFYWDESGTSLFVPGIPGMIQVVLDENPPPAVDLCGETRPYYAVSGVVAFRPVSAASAPTLRDPELAVELVILEVDPATLDGLRFA